MNTFRPAACSMFNDDQMYMPQVKSCLPHYAYHHYATPP